MYWFGTHSNGTDEDDDDDDGGGGVSLFVERLCPGGDAGANFVRCVKNCRVLHTDPPSDRSTAVHVHASTTTSRTHFRVAVAGAPISLGPSCESILTVKNRSTQIDRSAAVGERAQRRKVGRKKGQDRPCPTCKSLRTV